METKIFKNYEDFLNREDKRINGVTPDFLKENNTNLKDLNLTNCEGCFNCDNCFNCFNCEDCVDCRNCDNCKKCYNCENCDDCYNCEKSRNIFIKSKKI